MQEIRWVSIQNLIGGFALGAESSFETTPVAIIHQGWVNDSIYIRYMNETKKLNIPVIRMNADYTTFFSSEDEETFNRVIKNIDVAVCCPICSGLSQMNSSNEGSKARGDANNEQNKNMYNITELGMRIDAKIVTFENAPAAYTKSGESTINVLRDIATRNKYSTSLYYTDTLYHGIPQSRKRTFVTFFKESNPAIFDYQKVQTETLDDYLKKIPDSSVNYNDYIYEKYDALDDYYKFIMYETNSKSFLEAIDKIDATAKKSTWTSAQIVIELGIDKAIAYFDDEKIKNKLIHIKTKLEDGKSFWDNTTILANRGKFTNAIVGKSLPSMVHPSEERAYNIRELLHLMGMPLDFELNEPKKYYNCICQNVPVTTAKFICDNIKNYLSGNLQIYSSDFLKQNNLKRKIDTVENW